MLGADRVGVDPGDEILALGRPSAQLPPALELEAAAGRRLGDLGARHPSEAAEAVLGAVEDEHAVADPRGGPAGGLDPATAISK